MLSTTCVICQAAGYYGDFGYSKMSLVCLWWKPTGTSYY